MTWKHIRPAARCYRCHGSGRARRHKGFGYDSCDRCARAGKTVYPREGDLVIFWRGGRTQPAKAVKWDVLEAPEGDDWRALVRVRSRNSGIRREVQALVLYVLEEAEARVAGALMEGGR